MQNGFGALVKKVRVDKGLTLEQLSRRIGSHKGYLSGIENGKVNPPAPKLTMRLARALDIEPLDLVLLGWKSKMPRVLQGKVSVSFTD